VLDARQRGVAIQGSAVVRVADCTVRGRADDRTYRAAVSVDGTCSQVMVVNNFLGRGSDGDLQMAPAAGITARIKRRIF